MTKQEEEKVKEKVKEIINHFRNISHALDVLSMGRDEVSIKFYNKVADEIEKVFLK